MIVRRHSTITTLVEWFDGSTFHRVGKQKEAMERLSIEESR
jgi:hypothetical protein